MQTKCLIIDGPRGAGKTTLIKAITSRYPRILYPVKFAHGSLKLTSLGSPELTIPIQLEHLAAFVEQGPITPTPVFDRLIGTEVVMSTVLKRPLDTKLMMELDERWANFSIQVILMCNIAKGVGRSGKPAEGDSLDISNMWHRYAEATTIRTFIIDADESTPVDIANGVLSILNQMQMPIPMPLNGH